MGQHEPTSVVLAFLDAINSHDVDKLCSLMTEDHVFVDGLGNRVDGREKMRKGWTAYYQLFPDYRVSHEELFPQGQSVAVFGSAEGTFAVKGQLSKENHWSVPAAWLALVQDGLVKEWRVYADNQPVRKIMATPNP